VAVTSSRIGYVTTELPWEEANQTLAALQTRVVLLEQFVDGAKSPEVRALITAALLDTQKAVGRYEASLMGEDLDAGNHFAGMPSRITGQPGEL
jgi:hypothetical protein